jgi:hypothetical protein
MPRVLLRPALVVCPGDNMEVVGVDSSNEPHQGVVLDGRRLGVVDTGLLREGFRRLCHGGPDGLEAEVWLAMERVRLLALVVDDAMLLGLDAALGARLVLVRENRPAETISLPVSRGRCTCLTLSTYTQVQWPWSLAITMNRRKPVCTSWPSLFTCSTRPESEGIRFAPFGSDQ